MRQYSTHERRSYASTKIRKYFFPHRPQSLLECVQKFYPNLWHLKIVYDATDFRNMLESICKSHRNLRSLSFGITKSHLPPINIKSAFIFHSFRQLPPNLETLELYNLDGQLVFDPHGQKHLKRLKINGSIRTGNMISMNLEQLEELEIETREMHDEWIDLISRLYALKTLKILTFRKRYHMRKSISDAQLSRLNDLPRLEKLIISQSYD